MSQGPTTDDRVDRALGELLRWGVILSTTVVLVGGIIYLVRNGTDPWPDFHGFHGQPAGLSSIVGVLGEVAAGSGRGIVQLGVLLLIGTPIARVIFSVGTFAWQRDWTYVGVTLVVLAVLIYGLFV
jgi:uncharacterized membrane protein